MALPSAVSGAAYGGIGHAPRDQRGRIVVHDDFAGMKRAVNVARGVGGIEIAGDCAQPRDQIVDRRRSIVAQCGLK